MNISKKILSKIQESGKRYYACDNVAEFLTDKDREKLIDEVAEKFDEVLKSLLIDSENDPNSFETGRRLSKMYINEIMRGRYHPSPRVAAFPNEGEHFYKGMLVVRAEIKSVCAHHHQPVTGVAYIGVIPGKKVIGLSKYSRIAQHCARRGTLQEELTNQICQEIMRATESEDVAVYIEAEHGCCTNRGIMATSSLTQTCVLKGQFQLADVKAEFYDNIRLQKKS